MTKQKRHKPEEIILLIRECETSILSQESFCRQKQDLGGDAAPLVQKIWDDGRCRRQASKALEKENA